MHFLLVVFIQFYSFLITNMPEHSDFDVHGYYAAKEHYNCVLKDTLSSSSTWAQKHAEKEENEAQDLDPLLIPTFDGTELPQRQNREASMPTKK